MKIKGFNNRIIEGTEFIFTRSPTDSFKKKYSRQRIYIFKITLIILLTFFYGALIYLQIIRGSYYNQLAERNRIRIKEVKPLRGIIYDRNNIELVKNTPNFTLMAVPFDIYNYNFPKKIILNTLNSMFPKDKIFEEQIAALSNYSYVPVVLKKNISYEDGLRLMPIIQEWPGIFLQESFRREYLLGNSFSHILGYTSFVTLEDLKNDPSYSISDIIGKEGIEQTFEKILRGTKGQKYIEVNSLGKEDKIVQYKPSKRGRDVRLAIDVRFQQKLTEILEEKMNLFSVKRAAAIIMDPNNGEILALVSLPSFNNNLFTSKFNSQEYKALIQNPNNPLFNRAIKGAYPPGSIFKLIVGSGALEEKIVDEYYTVNSVGGISVGKWFFPDWLASGHGKVNIKEALAWSVNTYFYTIGGGYGTVTGLGLSGIQKYSSLFNLGKKLGIDLPGESTGFLPTKEWKLSYKGEQWYLGDTYHISIGQGDILVTPLQVADYTSFFANRGLLYKPHIIVEDPEILDKNFISSHNIEIINQGLRDAVRYGSARFLQSVPMPVAGKTGTAQFSQTKKPHGWFTGFAPFNNPQIVITILMEESNGAKSATRVALDFLNWYFKS